MKKIALQKTYKSNTFLETHMNDIKIKKSFDEINEKIKKGKAVVVTAKDMVDIVASQGVKGAFKKSMLSQPVHLGPCVRQVHLSTSAIQNQE